jgi:hypothetical protein
MDADKLWAQFTEMYRARREHDIFIITGGDFNRVVVMFILSNLA